MGRCHQQHANVAVGAPLAARLDSCRGAAHSVELLKKKLDSSVANLSLFFSAVQTSGGTTRSTSTAWRSLTPPKLKCSNESYQETATVGGPNPRGRGGEGGPPITCSSLPAEQMCLSAPSQTSSPFSSQPVCEGSGSEADG